MDHFLVSDHLFTDIRDYFSVHEGDNLSDHSPVVVSLDVSVNHVCTEKTFVQKPAWYKADESDMIKYRSILFAKMNDISIPHDALVCSENSCCEHYDAIARYHNDIVNACKEAAGASIPLTHRKSIVGWSDIVGPFKEESIFWHRLWKENGCQRNGVVYDIMLKCKRQYKRISRWVVRNREKLCADKMANAILSGQDRDFWTEVKKVQKKVSSTPNVVDDSRGEEAISSLFSEKYEELYNSVPYSDSEMADIRNKLDFEVLHRCATDKCYCNHIISPADVECAVKKLKSNKADVNPSINSNHLINGCKQLFVHVSFLFNAMLQHSYVPDEMCLAALVPIPKDRNKSISDSNNYRSIALGSILGKVLDNIILDNHSAKLLTSDLQFGFKQNHSTTQCTFVLQEVINYYERNGSACHAVLLDASKAFDRVHYVKLFNLLIDKGLCPLVAKLLVSLYTNQEMYVQWNTVNSRHFKCSNGIKQGGVLSPILFCVYIDELLLRLKNSCLGCHIGNSFMGAFSYADDLTILAPTISAAQKMLNICQLYANEFDVIFNSAKSIHVMYNVRHDIIPLTLNGSNLQCKEKAVHLGSFIGKDNHTANIDKAVSELIYQTNILMSKYSFCSTAIRCKLFKNFCSSYYGSPLWKNDFLSLQKLSVTWRKCIRKVMKLDYRTHSRYLPFLMNTCDFHVLMLCRYSSFITSCINAENNCIKLVMKMLPESQSIAANNLRNMLCFVQNDYSCVNNLFCSKSVIKKTIVNTWLNHCNDEDRASASVIQELIMHRDGEIDVRLTLNEVNELLSLACTA